MIRLDCIYSPQNNITDWENNSRSDQDFLRIILHVHAITNLQTQAELGRTVAVLNFKFMNESQCKTPQ